MYSEVIPQKLKQARIDAGYTQNQISEILDISQPILSRIETGEREPSLENLCRLIDFYEVSADWILGTGKKKTLN